MAATVQHVLDSMITAPVILESLILKTMNVDSSVSIVYDLASTVNNKIYVNSRQEPRVI